jgi:hypothetical protein
MSDWTSAAQDAKWIKAELRKKWPHVKWSVSSKSYSGGSSVDVSWTDGPTTRQVEVIAHKRGHVDRDHWGEILSGSNRYVFCNREHGERLQRYAQLKNANWSDYEKMSKWDKEVEDRKVYYHVEVRPDGQLIEWDRFAKFEKPENRRPRRKPPDR